MASCYYTIIWKGADGTLYIPFDGEEFDDIDLKLTTTGDTIVEISDFEVHDNFIVVPIESGQLDLLPDGVIRYALTIDGVTDAGNLNAVLKTPDGYDGETADDIYQRGFDDGLESCSGDCSGVYEEGFEDGYASGQTDCSGYTQADLDNAYNSGFTAGYQSGFTDGLAACSGDTPSSGDTPTSGSTSGGTDDYVPRSGSTVNDYFTIELIEKRYADRGNRAYFHFVNDSGYEVKTVEYRKNGGNWQTLTSNSEETPLSTFDIEVGDVVEFRGDNASYLGNRFYFKTTIDYSAGLTCVRGNIMSLIDSTNFSTATTLGACAFEDFLRLAEVYDAGDLLLPATTLGVSTYQGMFENQPLKYAPAVLPATDLTNASNCYWRMFCSSGIENAPTIPATIYSTGCFYEMFKDCSNLVTAPALLATTLRVSSCVRMFYRCSKLMALTCLATLPMDAGTTTDWLYGVPTYGIFTKSPSMNAWTRDSSGIPANWTVVDAS